MKLQKYTRFLTALACGAVVLQTGGCFAETLLPSVINIGLSAVLSLLFGTPL